VIRGNDELGARVLIDERYGKDGWGGVKSYLSEQEQEEFSLVNPEDARNRLEHFWRQSDE